MVANIVNNKLCVQDFYAKKYYIHKKTAKKIGCLIYCCIFVL